MPLGYYVVIEPRPPVKQIGTIVTSAKSQAADQALETVGKLLAVGSLAFTGEGFTLPLPPGVGDWVLYRQHAGQKMRLKTNIGDADPDGTSLSKYILVMQDTDVLGVFQTTAEAEKFRSWI